MKPIAAAGQGLETAGSGDGGITDSGGVGSGSGAKRRPSVALQDKIRMWEARRVVPAVTTATDNDNDNDTSDDHFMDVNDDKNDHSTVANLVPSDHKNDHKNDHVPAVVHAISSGQARLQDHVHAFDDDKEQGQGPGREREHVATCDDENSWAIAIHPLPLILIQRLGAVVTVRRTQSEIVRLRQQLQDIDADYRTAAATLAAVSGCVEKTAEKQGFGSGAEEQDELKDESDHLEVARSVVLAHLHRLELQRASSLGVLGLQSTPVPAAHPQNKSIHTSQHNRLKHDDSYHNHNGHNDHHNDIDHNNIDHSHDALSALITGVDTDDDGLMLQETRLTLLHLSAALIAHLSRQRLESDRKDGLHTLLAQSVEMFASQRRDFQQVTTPPPFPLFVCFIFLFFV